MSDREYAVWVLDTAPGQDLRIIPVGNRHQAGKRVARYEEINTTRGTYGITAKVVFKYACEPEMDWEDA